MDNDKSRCGDLKECPSGEAQRTWLDVEGKFREVASLDCDENGAVADACGDHPT
jgi:hypothetical protein